MREDANRTPPLGDIPQLALSAVPVGAEKHARLAINRFRYMGRGLADGEGEQACQGD